MFILWFIFVVLLILHAWTRYSRKGQLYNKIPGPKGLPVFGNIFMFAHCDQYEFWYSLRKLVRKYYPISRVWGFNQGIVNVFHPDDLEILLSSQTAIEKGSAYWYIKPWLGNGLLTSTGDKWRQRRKLLTPAFHFGILKKYMEITSEQAENLIESLKKEGNVIVKSLKPFFSTYTLNIICESTMGVALDKLDVNEITQYKQSVCDMGSVTVYRFLRPYLNNFIFPYVPKWGSMQTKALKILHYFTDKVIEDRKEYHKKYGNQFLNEYNEDSLPDDSSIYDDSKIGVKKRRAMLDLLLAVEKKDLIDKAGIHEEVDTFVFEGHDTTASAMTFLTLLLAENKEVQDRARAEVTAIMDATNGKAGFAEVQQFHYLERCIKESFRLFPPVPNLMRYLREDLQLKHALVPAHTHILIHLWDTHRDPNFWPEPEKFEPDRFLPENSKDRHLFSYVPFSAGPRNCIGQKFAMMEIKTLLGYMLYNFYLEPIERTADIPLVADLVMTSRDPVHVKFVKINK